MSLGPVARWLETFVCSSMCKQYVEVFQEFGYNNLNEVGSFIKKNFSLIDLKQLKFSQKDMQLKLPAAVENGCHSFRCRKNNGKRISVKTNNARYLSNK